VGRELGGKPSKTLASSPCISFCNNLLFEGLLLLVFAASFPLFEPNNKKEKKKKGIGLQYVVEFSLDKPL